MPNRLSLLAGALFALVVTADDARGSHAQATRLAPQAAVQTHEGVSFRRDVVPLLVGSCATRSCHGGGSRPPVLDRSGDAAKIRAALVDVASEDRPELPYVRPGSPDASFLVQKVEGTLVDDECTDRDCGSPMPADNPPLSASARATIRAWIARGARDD